jgi:RNA-directed DNA polymerase
LESGLPVIFEFDHLAALLGRTPAYLASAVNSTKNHYRVFEIPKRRGGMRRIDAPYPALLECQRWINSNILAKVPISSAAHGFTTGRSILTNASIHCSKKHLLKMDLKDFFPSIGIQRVIKVFQVLGYPNNVAVYLARLCCLSDSLPQGAATSPALSNIIAGRLDARLSGLAQKANLQYSRYADDMIFSGHHISTWFIAAVGKIAEIEGFTVNSEKTQLIRSDRRRIVTGLSVAGAEPRVPISYKRRLRQQVHFIVKYGYDSHASKKKIRDPFYIDSIYGKLTFWRSVEPDNAFVREYLPKIEAIKNS